MTQTPPSAQPGAGSQSDKFWDDISSTGLRRDKSRQWFAGVCSGIARRVDVDPVLIRAAFIALTLFGGFGLVIYLAAWLLMPDESGRIMARDAIHGDGSGEATGAIVLAVVAVVVLAAVIFGDEGFLIGWGIIPLAIVGWFFWRHEQGKKDVRGAQTTAMYAGSSPAAAGAPSYPVASQAPAATDAASAPSTQQAPWQQAPSSQAPSSPASWQQAPSQQAPWQPPPAPPVPPRAHVPLAPPPPPRPRRRTAGFAGFALVLGLAVVGYGAGLMLDDAVGFPGSGELLGGLIGLGLASLATMLIGLTGRRSLMSAALVAMLGLGVGGAGIVETAWDGDRGVRTWVPVATTTTQHFDHSAGRTTIDLRPLFASLSGNPDEPPEVSPNPQPSPVPTPTPGATASPIEPVPPAEPVPPVPPVRPVVAPQDLDIEQGAGEMTIIVPPGVNAQIRATAEFGEVRVVGNLPEGISDRDNGGSDGVSETLTLNLGSGAPTVIVDAEITFGEIIIQEG